MAAPDVCREDAALRTALGAGGLRAVDCATLRIGPFRSSRSCGSLEPSLEVSAD